MEGVYARSLWKIIEGGTEPKAAVHALAATLKKHGRMALLPRIGRAFARIAERENRRHGVTLTVAREKDSHESQREAKAVLREMGKEVTHLKTQVDESLIGGWRLEGNEILVDASYKRRLLDLYKKTTGA